jgi:hypothetical protein
MYMVMRMGVLKAALLAALIACGETTGPGVEGPLLLVARVDGTSWVTDNGGNTFSYLRPDGYLFMGAITRDSDPVSLGATNFYSTPPNAGELVITEVDTVAHRVAGRFDFEAREEPDARQVSVARGFFRVKYTDVL